MVALLIAETSLLIRSVECLIALIGVFAGALLWDVLFGDGIQGEDYSKALTVGLIAAAIQWGVSRHLRRKQS